MQKFFDNTLTIQAEAATISAILLDPSRLIQWNPAIQAIRAERPNQAKHPRQADRSEQPDQSEQLQKVNQADRADRAAQPTGNERRYQIGREREAINQAEELTIGQSADLITYSVTGNRLSYRVQFQLTDNGGTTAVAETVLVDAKALPGIPLTMLRPVTKHAFLTNLRALAVLAERGTQRVDFEH